MAEWSASPDYESFGVLKGMMHQDMVYCKGQGSVGDDVILSDPEFLRCLYYVSKMIYINMLF